MSGTAAAGAASPFRQPKAVFAVAFACVVSFMGIGLVDPILPAISHELHASPSEVTLLFTSYLVVTAVAMLITNWVSSRLGAKKTLIAGLALIVVFSAAAGASPGIGGIIGFRAGWGVGNALFIATSLAVIVASASGGIVLGIIILSTAHRLLGDAERVQAEQVAAAAASTGMAGSASTGPAGTGPVARPPARPSP